MQKPGRLTGESTPKQLTRRGFLSLGAATLISLALQPLESSLASSPGQQGRVTENLAGVHSEPSFDSPVVDTLWKDAVISILAATIGSLTPIHNRVWYRINDQAYIHSGIVQPVQTRLNPVVNDIPLSGTLAETTVPFTDAHWGAGKSFPVAYRMYYETTHWITSLDYDQEGTAWYRLKDDKWDITYFAPAAHLRIIPANELTMISQDVPPRAKRLEVIRELQAVVAYEWDQPVFMTRAATGAVFSNGNFTTPAGRHITSFKRPYRHMAAGNLAYNGYDLPGVPWVTYITQSGISFHGTYWHNDFGLPRSHGCINLTPQAARWLYRWTHPFVPPHAQEAYDDQATIVDVL